MQQPNQIATNSTDEYLQSWYPVSRCCDLAVGQHKAVKLFGQDWLLFRTESGKVSFVSRYCCHMGADLCQGKVVDETIECPLHAWQFDVSGDCVHIPDLEKPLPSRKLQNLVCKEKYGLIFIFFGNEPLFDIPSPPDIGKQQAYSQARIQNLNSSHQVLSINAFDTQHLKHVHNRAFNEQPSVYPIKKYALRMDSKVEVFKKERLSDRIIAFIGNDNMSIATECWGGSIITLTNFDLNASALVALQPVDKNQTKAYLISIKEHTGKVNLFTKIRLSIAVRLLQSFLQADLKPISNMRLHHAGILDDLDHGVQTYWQHFKAMPHFSMQRKTSGKDSNEG